MMIALLPGTQMHFSIPVPHGVDLEVSPAVVMPQEAATQGFSPLPGAGR